MAINQLAKKNFKATTKVVRLKQKNQREFTSASPLMMRQNYFGQTPEDNGSATQQIQVNVSATAAKAKKLI